MMKPTSKWIWYVEEKWFKWDLKINMYVCAIFQIVKWRQHTHIFRVRITYNIITIIRQLATGYNWNGVFAYAYTHRHSWACFRVHVNENNFWILEAKELYVNTVTVALAAAFFSDELNSWSVLKNR